MQPALPQSAVAERHRAGAVLSRKARLGQAMRSEPGLRKPFFAPNEPLLVSRLTRARINGQPPVKSLATPIPNSLLAPESLLINPPFVGFELATQLASTHPKSKLAGQPVAFSPTISPVVAQQMQPSNGEMKVDFTGDFHPILVEPVKKDGRAEPPDAPAGDVAETLAETSAPAAPQAKAAPATPEADPQFQATMQDIRQTHRTLRKHPDPQKKVNEYVLAAVLPEAAQKKQHDSQQHLTTIDTTAQQVAQAKQEAFKPETFKELLKSNLDELEGKLPKNESGAKRFKRDKPLEVIKQQIAQQIAQTNAAQLHDVNSEVGRKQPPPSNAPVQEAKTYKTEPTGRKPAPIDAVAATPKPKPDAEISLEAKSTALDTRMATRHVTDQQLADSNEPQFLSTLAAKQQAQQQAAQAPQTYRQAEQRTLATAQKKASATAQTKGGGMFAKRQQTFLEVVQQQNLTELFDKGKQLWVNGQFLATYDGTKTQVKRILQELSTYVDETFTRESEDAKKRFERVVEDQLDEIHGLGIKDFFWGPDTEAIEQVFAREASTFKLTLGYTLDKIAVEIARRLNEAVACIEQGQQRSETLFASLDKDQQQLHGDTFSQFKTQFDTLRTSVDDKQAELAQSLADSYKANVDSLDETFHKIDEEVSRTWIDDAVDFIEDAALAIYRLGQLLFSVLSRLADMITDILAHPIRFLENVGAGIKQGFERFVAKFDEYLLTGFFDWLRGSVASTSIQLPASFDGKGLFSLATQLTGLNYTTFREIAVDKLGSPVVVALEKGEEWIKEGFEKGIELFQIVKKDGLSGLWEHVSGLVAEGISELFAKIKKTILYEAVQKALAYVATLFNPVGAFIQAALALYHGIKFLIDNISRLEELVNSFLDSLELAVKGNVTGIADKVVLALRNSIVLAIDFLAKLLNLGNLVDKARRLIHTIQTPIKRAMGWVLDKFKPLAQRAVRGGKALVAKGKKAVTNVVGAVVEWWKASKSFKAKDGKPHKLYLRGQEDSTELMVASAPTSYKQFFAQFSSIDPTDPQKTQKEAAYTTGLQLASEIAAISSERHPQAATEEDKRAIRRDKRQRIDTLLEQLWPHTATLLAGQEAPTGLTEAEAIPIQWFKPMDLYHRVVLLDLPESERGFDWNMREKLPPNQLGQRLTIGLLSKSLPRKGKTFQRLNDFRGSQAELFKLTLQEFGFDWSGLDPDHVQDLQFSGEDGLANLWPLDSSANRSAGSRQLQYVVHWKSGNGQVIAIKVGDERLVGRYFKIDRIEL